MNMVSLYPSHNARCGCKKTPNESGFMEGPDVSVDYRMNDIVQMKKPHPCGENRWQIIRLGMDIRIKCQKCGHSVLIPRLKFNRTVRKVILRAEDEAPSTDEHRDTS